MTTEAMPEPQWDEDLKKQMREFIGGESVAENFKVESLERITNYSTYFAEWEMKKGTVLIHLFPRGGSEDKWENGYYLPKCRACRRDVPRELAQTRKPCPTCGHVGLIYVPGRIESAAKVRFPADVLTRVKSAVDAAWEGGVAIEPMQELGAVVVQFQDVSIAEEQMLKMLETFFDSFDASLEK